MTFMCQNKVGVRLPLGPVSTRRINSILQSNCLPLVRACLLDVRSHDDGYSCNCLADESDVVHGTIRVSEFRRARARRCL